MAILEFIKGVWDDIVEFAEDLPIKVIKGILDAVYYVLSLIPTPDFLSNFKIGSILGPVEPYIGYFLQMSGLGNALLIVASGVAFRLTRKLVTLGQW